MAWSPCHRNDWCVYSFKILFKALSQAYSAIVTIIYALSYNSDRQLPSGMYLQNKSGSQRS